MGRVKLAESGDVADHPEPGTLAFTLAVMRSCKGTGSQQEEWDYTKDIVLVVFQTMGNAETRAKLEEMFRDNWSTSGSRWEKWRQDDGLQVEKREICLIYIGGRV